MIMAHETEDERYSKTLKRSEKNPKKNPGWRIIFITDRFEWTYVSPCMRLPYCKIRLMYSIEENLIHTPISPNNNTKKQKGN